MPTGVHDAWPPPSEGGENCGSTEDKMRQFIEEKVYQQGVFNADGSVRGDFAYAQALAECLTANTDPSACQGLSQAADGSMDPIGSGRDGESQMAAAIASMLWSAPGGYNPKRSKLCGGANAIGGVYEIVDIATDVVVYIGSTNDFDRRRREHFNKTGSQFYGEDDRLQLRPRYRTYDHEAARGLEQHRFDDLWGDGREDATIDEARARGSRNLQRPMAFDRDVRPNRLELAKRFLRECV